MIRDLCRSPPSFKSNVILSWKPTVKFFFFKINFRLIEIFIFQEELKRSISETDGGSTTNKNGVGSNPTATAASANTANKRARPERQLYRPPSGAQAGGQKNRRGGYQRY